MELEQAFLRRFPQQMLIFFLLGSSDEKISILREELPSKESIRFFTVDLSQRENVNNFCDSIIEEFGGISVVINNAGSLKILYS